MKHFYIVKSIENESIRKVLFISFALIFALPLLIFFLVVNHYNLLQERFVQISIVGYLIFSLLGFILLRHITDEIISFSKSAKKLIKDTSLEDTVDEYNELKTISKTFQKLVEKLEENTVSLGKRISELSAIFELTVITSKISDFNELFEIVLEKIFATTNSHRGMMLSITNEGKKMKVEATLGIGRSLIPKNEIDVNETIFSRVIKDNEVIVCDDPAYEPGFTKPFDTILKGGPCIVKAIKARGKNIAVLILSRGKNGEPFKGMELDYISTALGQIAFALDNAQLIRELKDSYDELEQMQQKLINYERASAINQTVVTLNDRINNPLTVIQGHVELIRKNFSIDDEKFNQSLELIQESVQKCKEIMSKLQKIREPVVKLYADMGTSMIDIDSSIFDNNHEQTSQDND